MSDAATNATKFSVARFANPLASWAHLPSQKRLFFAQVSGRAAGKAGRAIVQQAGASQLASGASGDSGEAGVHSHVRLAAVYRTRPRWGP